PLWLGCLQYEARVGAVFYMQQDRAKAEAGDVAGATSCEIMTLDPPHTFSFSWFARGYPPTFVTVELEALPETRSRVTLTHEGWDQFPAEMIRPVYEALSNGWASFVLPALKREAEG